MRRLFLFCYDNEVGTREAVKAAIDSNPLIVTWRYDLPNMFYLVSDVAARPLSESIRATLPNGRFVVVAGDEDYWGWNHDETWHLFIHKNQKPKSGT